MHKQQSYVLATSQSCQPQEEKQSWQEDAPLQEEVDWKHLVQDELELPQETHFC